MHFKQLELTEERIVNHLKIIAMGYHPIKVELQNFGSYPSHTIFIDVTTKEPIKNLVKQIKPWQKLLKMKEDNKPYFIDDPVITAARQLKPWQYENAWPVSGTEFHRKAYRRRNAVAEKRSRGKSVPDRRAV